jgi:hypothetical protein
MAQPLSYQRRYGAWYIRLVAWAPRVPRAVQVVISPSHRI